ncbi:MULTISPECIES: YeeE/YedE family protein [Alphaproteobacteria]|uniref:Membrane protein n=2 Tax=Alphaproteobacteria TaxID=28211 RepID=A0A512HI36_9HYPH|nr:MULTISPECIES: YeeE/YedE family protein [Alphaproteobacteria]GEO85111.1 membrane protein [Ciceribacter naphthalenivorans]GLR24555.1 membrane protein [Ciceribacter naphthalenivorans]GLT07411.1 membrane protein [Sphingomonas psychrolutea]
MTQFTPLLSFAGGALIGLAAVLLMAFWGRIAGMSAIVIGVFPPLSADWAWRAAFLVGAIGAPALLALSGYEASFSVPISLGALIVGGLVTGLGVTFGSGCTSGHGVCGMARLSPRSIAATASFMAGAFVTVYLIRHVF